MTANIIPAYLMFPGITASGVANILDYIRERWDLGRDVEAKTLVEAVIEKMDPGYAPDEALLLVHQLSDLLQKMEGNAEEVGDLLNEMAASLRSGLI